MPLTAKPIRVLVADDSALMRRMLRAILESDPEFELVGVARDGEDALVKARELRPDVVSLDINMPKMDGLTALQLIVSEQICPVIMCSSLTQKGAITTLEALELGAFDYVGKPDGTVSADMGSVAKEMREKLRAAAHSGHLGKLRARNQRREAPTAPKAVKPAVRTRPVEVKNGFGYRAVAIGISTGGPSTLMEVLPKIPQDLGAAIFLVQHMPAKFVESFAQRLDRSCAVRVQVAESGMLVEPGCCYIAKGDYQLGLFRKLNGEVVLRTPSYPQTLFMPSVDVMMQSVLQIYGNQTIGVLMTGIGDDGADAMVKIAKAGGVTIAESEQTAVVFGMPREAIERGGAQVVSPSYEIADQICRYVAQPVA